MRKSLCLQAAQEPPLLGNYRREGGTDRGSPLSPSLPPFNQNSSAFLFFMYIVSFENKYSATKTNLKPPD